MTILAILAFLCVSAVLFGIGIAFLYPWDMDRKPKQKLFSGAGVGWEKPIQQVIKVNGSDTTNS